jgi:DNA-binding LacI/PurR family transcriptional regulator
MPISIRDIAHRSGVSHATVSRALNDSPLVKQETAARIKEIARVAGYTPSAVGRSLVTGKTRAIGVVVTRISDPFGSEIVDGIEDAASNNGFSVILACAHAVPEREIAIVRSLKERRVDGVVVAASRVGALYPELLVHGDATPQGARAPMEQLLSLAARPTAVFCYNDRSALGALQTASMKGLRVPDDISLVGVDDLFFTPFTHPPLTTFRQPMRTMGRLAAEVLLS